VGAERMLGYSADEVVNRIRPSDLHDPVEVLARAQALSLELGVTISPGFEALAFKASRGIEDTYELTYICADGSRFPAIVSITALRGGGGDVIGYLLIGSHNSIRKRVELELNNARDVAEQANLAKSEFLSNMSHELRTPLNAILGFTQLLESGTPSPSAGQRRSLEQILKAGWYLLDLINEILDLALIESGKLSLSLEPIALAEVLSEVQAMIEPQASKRDVHVEFLQIDAPHRLKVDRIRLKQILINLLSNAIKYNREGGEVQVACGACAPGRIRISVRDTGEGMSAQQIAQLFQPFNRLGQETRQGEGTGIGLVLAKRLVELMDGRIDVQSTAGEGSIFSIELNLAAAATDRAVQAVVEPMAQSSGPAAAVVSTLLYVEDNPANLKLVEEIMERRPHIRMLSARDGPSGIAIARAARPQVILMDINLPRMSGIEALRILRHDPRTAHIPVAALSANAGDHDRHRGLEAGFFVYLTKPIKVIEFLDAIDRAFELASANPSAAAPETET
jgi:signal transduction histidine kinase/CheY-like chemotaxis protein